MCRKLVVYTQTYTQNHRFGLFKENEHQAGDDDADEEY